MELLLLGLQKLPERFLLAQQAFISQNLADLLGKIDRRIDRIAVKRLRDFQRFAQRPLDLLVEPPPDALRNQVAGDHEQQQRRNNRKNDERDDEPGLKLCAENVLLAIQIELDDIPHDHQNQDDQQDDVDVEQGEDEEIIDQRHRIVQLLDEDFNRRQKGQADHDQPDDEAVALSFLFDFCGHVLKKGLTHPTLPSPQSGEGITRRCSPSPD